DGTETVSCTWMSPRAALGAYEAGRIVLIPPTVRTLDDLARFPSIDAVLADAAGRVVRAVTPELVQDGSLTAIRHPGNAPPPRRLVLQGGRWRAADDWEWPRTATRRPCTEAETAPPPPRTAVSGHAPRSAADALGVE